MSDPGLTPQSSDARMRRDAERLKRRSWNVDWKVVAFVLVSGLGGTAWLFTRIGGAVDEVDAYLPDPLPPPAWELPAPAVAPPVVAEEPAVVHDTVEWRVHVGDWSAELDRERFTLPGDIPVRLAPTERLVWSTETLSFRYPRGFLVEPAPGGGVVIRGPGGSSVRISAIAPDADLALEAEKALADLDPTLARVDPPRRRTSAQSYEGAALSDGERVAAEAHALRFTEERAYVVRAIPGMQHRNEVADILRSLSPEPREPGGVVSLWYLGVENSLTTERTPLSALPGAPDAWAEPLPAVVERLGSISFTRPREVLVTRLPGRITLEDGGTRLHVATEDEGEPAGAASVVRREVAGERREGTRVRTPELVREIFSFDLEGARLTLALEHAPRDRRAATALFDAVAPTLSVR